MNRIYLVSCTLISHFNHDLKDNTIIIERVRMLRKTEEESERVNK